MKKNGQAIRESVDQEDNPSSLPSPFKGEGEEEKVLRANIPEEEIFTLGVWGEFKQWRCRFCPWDTLEGEAAMREHFQAVHAPPPEPPQVSMIVRADRFGNEVRE